MLNPSCFLKHWIYFTNSLFRVFINIHVWNWLLIFFVLSLIFGLEIILSSWKNLGFVFLFFKFDLKFTIFTEYTETCRSACFQGLWMFHDSYGEWTDFFKKTFQWLAKFHHHHHCKAHTLSLRSRYWDSNIWETLTVQGSLSITFFSILNLCMAPTLHSRFKCTCLWNTFDHSLYVWLSLHLI